MSSTTAVTAAQDKVQQKINTENEIKLLLFDCDMFTCVILKISLKKINTFQFFLNI